MTTTGPDPTEVGDVDRIDAVREVREIATSGRQRVVDGEGGARGGRVHEYRVEGSCCTTTVGARGRAGEVGRLRECCGGDGVARADRGGEGTTRAASAGVPSVSKATEGQGRNGEA